MNHNIIKLGILVVLFLSVSSCTVYTEKRSEALSQAVYATAESIKNARFDKAGPYAEQAKRLAYAPKNQISVPPIITSSTRRVEATNNTTDVKRGSSSVNTGSKINTSLIKASSETQEDEQVLRLVIPESLKHAKLLIENSDEWNELLKTKKFKEQLEVDNANLQRLVSDIDAELQKQLKYNNQMVIDLNNMKTELAEKNLAILQRNIIIVGLLLAIGGATYLRIKGIL